MADDVADVDVAAGLFDCVGEDGEDFAFVGDFGGDEAGFLAAEPSFWRGGGWAGCGLLFLRLTYSYGIILHLRRSGGHPTDCNFF